VPADADKQFEILFATTKVRKTTGGSIGNRQTFLVRKPALCAQVRGIFADADAVARRKVR
jgi:hypothetical protein